MLLQVLRASVVHFLVQLLTLPIAGSAPDVLHFTRGARTTVSQEARASGKASKGVCSVVPSPRSTQISARISSGGAHQHRLLSVNRGGGLFPDGIDRQRLVPDPQGIAARNRREPSPQRLFPRFSKRNAIDAMTTLRHSIVFLRHIANSP